jgi:hypothetical protein
MGEFGKRGAAFGLFGDGVKTGAAENLLCLQFEKFLAWSPQKETSNEDLLRNMPSSRSSHLY